jgi:MazG family protein
VTGRSDRARAARAGRLFARLVIVMAQLRSRRGCPWDRRQTPQSLRPFLLEETYEALDAIDRGDLGELRGELGDVLFQCVFQSQIAAERRVFDAGDSLQSIIDKLVRRHPHVFRADGRLLPRRAAKKSGVRTAGRVLQRWEALKAGEQQAAGRTPRVLAGVPRALPALLRAHEIGARVAAVGFDWPDAAGVIDKIEEELAELRDASGRSRRLTEEEFGDLLFSIANLARRLGLDPEAALRQANDKFTRRFEALEADFERRGRALHGAPLAELEAAWQAVKRRASTRRKTASGRAPSAPGPSRRPSRSRSRRRGRS